MFLLLPAWAAAGTNPDSLRTLYNEARSQQQVEREAYFAFQIANDFVSHQQWDSALYFLNRSLEHTTSISTIQRASSHNAKGAIFDQLGAPDSSIQNYLAAHKIYENLRDTASLVIVETNLAATYMTKGWYDKALEFGFRSLDKLENKGASRALASCYNTLAFVYMRIGDHDRSLQYHHKALTVRQQLNYARGVGQSYNNLGETFLLLNQLDSARHYLLAAYNVKSTIGEKGAATLNNLGDVYVRLGLLQQADSTLQHAWQVNKEENNLLGQVKSLHLRTKLALFQKKYPAAESHLQTASTLLATADALEDRRENAELSIALHKAQNNPTQALAYAEKLLDIREQILTKQKVESLAAMQAKYEAEKREQQIQLLQSENNVQQAQLQLNTAWLRALTVIAILLLAIVALVGNQYRLTRQSKQTVEMLLRELNHRVKNNLQVLSGILTLQSQELKDESALQAIKSNEGRINAMALIHRKLYNHGAEQVVQLKDYIAELAHYLAQTFGLTEDRVELKLAVDDVSLHVDKAIPLGLILNELITNAFKYAFNDRYPGQLSIALRLKHGVDLDISVADNGPGIPTTPGTQASFGLRMVAMLVKELKGTYQIKSYNGTEVTLTIPYL